MDAQATDGLLRFFRSIQDPRSANARHQLCDVLTIAILAVLQAFLTTPVLVTVTESLPKAVRSGALAILYALAISVFGGSTQFVIKALSDLSGSPLAPAWYMTGAVLIGGIAMALMPETAPVKVGLAPGH